MILRRLFFAALFCSTLSANMDAELGVGHLNLKSVTWVYGGLNTGYSVLNAQVNGENRKNGFHMMLKVGTRLFQLHHWDFDLYAGWLHNGLSRVSNGTTINATVNAGFSELAVRYRWSPRLFVGPSLIGFYASNANHGETVRDQNFGALVGPSIIYELPLKSSRLRFGLETFWDMNISNRQLLMVGGTIQYGFPLGAAGPKPRKLQTGAQIIARKTSLTVILPETYLDFNGKQPSDISRKFLREVAELLSKENPDWTQLIVESHLMGPKDKTSEKLSTEKADNVLKALVFFGVTTKKARSEGKAASEPQYSDPEKAPYNTRIELEVSGSKEPLRLKEQLRRLLNKYEP